MCGTIKKILILTSCQGLMLTFAYAQVDAGALQQNLERQMPLPSPLELPEPSKATPITPPSAKAEELRFTLHSFVLEGVRILPENEVQDAIKAWVGVSVGFSDLQDVCDVIQGLYRSRGYQVQATLPPQKIANGVVKILVTEATLGKVTIDSPKGATRFGEDRASSYITYANRIGEPLNMRAISRAIAILNETPGVMASSQMEQGDKQGEAALRVQLTQPDLMEGRVEVNNYGSRTTGANQGVLALALNSPFGLGDSFSINGISSLGSQYLQGAVSMPGSMDGLRIGLAGTYLQYRNVSNYTYNGGMGDAWTGGLSAAYPLLRSAPLNLNASVNYDIKSYNNQNLASGLVVGAYNLNNLSIGLSGNFYDSLLYGSVSAASISIVQGHLSILATSQEGYGQYILPPGSGVGRAFITPSNFTKFSFSGNRNQQLVAEGTSSLYVAVSGQLSSVNLSSAEQFYLGGPYAVRAYPVAQSGGSQGGLLTIELRHELIPMLRVSTFFDAGLIQQYKNLYPGWQGLTNANNTYSLMGAGLGLKWGYQGWSVDAAIAWKVGQNPLFSQSGQPVNADATTTQPRGWLTGSYTF